MNTHIAQAKTFAFLIAALVLTQACTSLHGELPVSRFESPESNGVNHRFGFQGSYTQANDYQVAPDASARPPDFTRPSLTEDQLVGMQGSFGILENLDFSLRTTFGPSPTMAIVKFQIYGPSSDVAKQGDSSLAVTLGYGGGKSTKSGDQSGLFGPGGHNWSGSMENQAKDAAVIAGYRASDRVLIYGGAFYTDYTLNSNIDQQASDDGSSPAANYSVNARGYQSGGNLGFQIFLGASPLYTQIEGTYSTAHISNTQRTLLKVGASLGASF